MADEDDQPKKSQTPAGRPAFGKVVASASTSVVNLGVVGSAAVAAAALGSWPILALGGAAYAALVAFDTTNPSFWKKVFSKGGSGGAAAPKLPAPKQIVDPPTRAAIEQLLAARAHLERVLAETPKDILAQLGPVIGSLGELEERAARLVLRAEELQRYLSSVNESAVRKDIEQLAARASGAADEQARQGFAQARAAREEELRTLGELQKAKERLDANLLRVVATVGGLPSKVVHMRALDAQAMDDLSGDMNAELERLVGEMSTFEATLKTLVEAPIP